MRKWMFGISVILAVAVVMPGCGSSGGDDSRDGRSAGDLKGKQSSALYEAARHNNIEKIEELLSEGYDVNSRGRGGRTALWIASYEGYLRAAMLLLDEGADPTIADDRNKRTPLMYAADKRYNELLKKMLATKPDVNAQDVRGMTAAHMAANKRDVEAVRWLKAAGADLSLQDERGRTVDDILQIMVGQPVAVIAVLVNGGSAN
jgi:ankyrin repeat protein